MQYYSVYITTQKQSKQTQWGTKSWALGAPRRWPGLGALPMWEHSIRQGSSHSPQSSRCSHKRGCSQGKSRKEVETRNRRGKGKEKSGRSRSSLRALLYPPAQQGTVARGIHTCPKDSPRIVEIIDRQPWDSCPLFSNKQFPPVKENKKERAFSPYNHLTPSLLRHLTLILPNLYFHCF